MMVRLDFNNLRERDRAIDLESGTCARTNEEERSTNPNAKHLLNKVWNGYGNIDGSNKNADAAISVNNFSSFIESPLDNEEFLCDKRFEGGDKVSPLEKVGPEKSKKKSSKKPPRPPRPPRAPSLDAADQKLVREISEAAMVKRARIEKMKALKRMKNAKSASSNNNLFALIITLIFCLLIIWQGVFSKGGSGVSFQGSPVLSAGSRAGFISVQLYKNVSTNHYSGSASPNNVELVSGLEDHGKASRATG